VPGKRVLLVDDDQDLLLAESDMLRSGGYEVLAAADAIRAMSVAVKERPDAVVLDIDLPGGDGTTVMQRLHALPQLAGLPVLILSARDPADDRDAALEAGAVAYVNKPVQSEELLAAVRLAIGGPEVDRPESEAPAGPAETSAGRLVLLVDDDLDLLDALATALRASGFEVAVAVDAVGAITSAVKRRPDAAVVLGFGLPGGDGLAVMQRLHARPQLAGLPVLILSGRDPAEYSDAALEAGAVAYVAKPVDTEELVTALRAALESA